MKYLSVCSGIEAATVAWHTLGWTPVAFSEIETFPSQVLAHHYPQTPNLGDMTKFYEWNCDGIDLLVGGTPCQSFSVAGLRKGLTDPRGNLALVYCGILDRFRPKWFVWENVPGVLSSNGGRDFGSFLGALAELGYGFSYRVLDAQYFGVAQRRRRVFVVGHLGDWRPAATVLFECESLRRDTAPSRKEGQVTPTLTKECTGVSRTGHNEDGWYIPTTFDRQSSGEYGLSPVASTMAARDYKSASDLVAQPMPINTMVALRHEALGRGTGFGLGEAGDPAYTLTKGHSHAVYDRLAVRRLTPVECERLQGFPDDYTNIRPKGKETPDGPRYKALGNSMAVPVMNWIGRRIAITDMIL